MKRKEYLDFFSKNYDKNFINHDFITISQEDKKYIKNSLNLLDSWFNNYYNFVIKNEKQYNNKDIISNPFSFKKKKDIKEITKLVVETYFNCILRSAYKYTNFNNKRRIRRKIYDKFFAGRYFTNEVGSRIIEMINILNK